MKITIERKENCAETQILVTCPAEPDAESEDILQMLTDYSVSLNVCKEGVNCRVRIKDILYIECVDDRTFLYSGEDTYETPQKLYRLEEQLNGTDFVRVSKSALLNINHLESVRPLLNAKIEARMVNGERILINRHYVASFREKFGL